jgi:hypothetical protein
MFKGAHFQQLATSDDIFLAKFICIKINQRLSVNFPAQHLPLPSYQHSPVVTVPTMFLPANIKTKAQNGISAAVQVFDVHVGIMREPLSHDPKGFWTAASGCLLLQSTTTTSFSSSSAVNIIVGDNNSHTKKSAPAVAVWGDWYCQ